MSWTSSNLFSVLIIVSPLFLISTKSLIIFWLLMEMTTISFIMLFSTSIFMINDKFILYFIIQTMASIMFLSFYFLMEMSNLEINMIQMKTTIFITIMLKMGLYPLHLWVLKIGNLLPWKSLMFMLTWQKIIPILMFIKTTIFSMIMVPILSILMGTLSQLSMNMTKKIILLSSITHSGWMMLMNFSWFINMFYYMIYSIISISLFKMINLTNKTNLYFNTKSNSMSILILLMSLSGIPPLLGFMPKWMIMNNLVQIFESKFILISLFIMMTINFFIYTQFFFNFLTLKYNQHNIEMKMKKNNNQTFLMNCLFPMLFLLM